MDKFEEILKTIPQLTQRQDSTESQLVDLIRVANKLGMYDAADLLVRVNTRRG